MRVLNLYDEARNAAHLTPANSSLLFSGAFVLGSAASDKLTGTNGNDSMFGYGGNDTLTAAAGNDTVDGGAGSDLIVGGSGAGNDRYAGGAGVDTVKYTSATHKITVTLTPAGAAIYSLASGSDIGHDKLVSIENVIAGKGDDEITGNGLDNRLSGDTGNDTLKGLGGDDTLSGQAGNDHLIGYAGNDEITGGRGRDIMTGGTGADDFNFESVSEMGKTASTRDRITDFAHGVDDIDLSAIDASTKAAGDQKFKFIATAGFHGAGRRAALREGQSPRHRARHHHCRGRRQRRQARRLPNRAHGTQDADGGRFHLLRKTKRDFRYWPIVLKNSWNARRSRHRQHAADI